MAAHGDLHRPHPGTVIGGREFTPVSGPPIRVPEPGRLVHLQFRRFAGCPVCNLHLRSIVRRHAEIEAAGIREVVVFHSPADELREHTADLPFAVIADPDKRLYVEFGVESARRALLHPRAWIPILRAVLRSTWAIIRRREHGPAANPHGGRFGLPADFLIAEDGRVLACKYGEHVYDQWSVDELLAQASRSPRPAAQDR
ncbi:AhpC/TSA family protein [Actinoallomurus purpureus]|uniref:peroxiredoxin-like family protein n=1 Tax=Actinoallomurus purpureus TaxID=478114 RepID=UPI002093584E|nr:peroxiredoxin-like family protein [Actinoallomurus purpureus]MCO6007168.1 AhpC/TSA family protein [Actinoallomurus purpureus]